MCDRGCFIYLFISEIFITLGKRVIFFFFLDGVWGRGVFQKFRSNKLKKKKESDVQLCK